MLKAPSRSSGGWWRRERVADVAVDAVEEPERDALRESWAGVDWYGEAATGIWWSWSSSWERRGCLETALAGMGGRR